MHFGRHGEEVLLKIESAWKESAVRDDSDVGPSFERSCAPLLSVACVVRSKKRSLQSMCRDTGVCASRRMI
jgi:hypothetical protein